MRSPEMTVRMGKGLVEFLESPRCNLEGWRKVVDGDVRALASRIRMPRRGRSRTLRHLRGWHYYLRSILHVAGN